MLPSELGETISFMRDTIRAHPTDMRAALTIVELTTLIHAQSYDDAQLPHLLAILHEAERLHWPDEESASVALAKLKLQFNLGLTQEERQAAVSELEQLVQRTNATTVPSWRSISLVSGVGILAASLGHSDKAIAQLEAAKKLAQRLDSPQHLATLNANLALRHGWLGNYHKQREYATEVLAVPTSLQPSIYSTIMATYEYALASIMLGDHAAARRALDQQQYRVPTTATAALQQTWMLLRADLEHLLRNEELSLALSREALQLGANTILSWRTSSGAGSRAALRVINCGGEQEARDATRLLQDLLQRRSRMELAEEIEVLCAFAPTCESPTDRDRVIEDLRLRLERLPPAANRRLEALGTAPPAECLPPEWYEKRK
jgi:tetratricopeptide (TPR) repeat protein